MGDLLTVVVKEWRELLRLRGRIRSTAAWTAVLLAVFGIVFPVMSYGLSVTTGLGGVFAFWVPTMLVLPVIADSIAGERERHTLETLLASRLPTPAILAGKLVVAVAYGLLAMAALQVISHLTVWLYIRPEQLPLAAYRRQLVVGLPLAAFGVLLFASVGALVSLHAPTVRQAQQSIGLVMILLPSLACLAWSRLPPETAMAVARRCGFGGPGSLASMLLLLGGASAICLALAVRRFERRSILR